MCLQPQYPCLENKEMGSMNPLERLEHNKKLKTNKPMFVKKAVKSWDEVRKESIFFVSEEDLATGIDNEQK
jgi:hypothetical protein